MDFILEAVDEHLVEPWDVYPAGWERDYVPRQCLTIFTVVLLGAYALYFICAGLNYWFLFDRRLRQHPKFLVDQERKEISSACRSLPWMALLTLPLFVLEVRGHSQLYGSLDAATNYGVDEHPGGWRYLAFSVAAFMFFNDMLIYWIHRALHSKALYAPLHKVRARVQTLPSARAFASTAPTISPSTRSPVRPPAFSTARGSRAHCYAPPPAVVN